MTFNNALKTAALPLDIAWADRSENLYILSQAFESLEPETDIVVLPELFTTGFIAQADQAIENAEPLDDRDDHTLATLLRLSHKYRVAIVGSYLKRSIDGHPLNHAVFVEPTGEVTTYDKHHLFGLSPEKQLYVAGSAQPPVVRYRGWNISMIVCYDLRFPCWCRNRGLRYDMLLVPANWPESRQYAWEHLLIARAIENQAVVVGVNRSGTDDYGSYGEGSGIYDYCGQPIERRGRNGWIYATVERAQLQQYRKRFPFYADAD